MLELWQSESCPASKRIRARLTELGVDYRTRQVPVEKAQRATPRQATGSETIPALRLEEGTIATGEAAIRRYLDDHFPVEADADQLKAAQARRRYLEEECECSQPATR